MRIVLILSVCAWYVVGGQDINAMKNLPKYDVRYDYLDVDAILDSKRLVRNYVDCLISAQRCTPEGKALKRLLPEALRTKCVRCTDKQKRTAVKVIKRIKYEYPNEWAKLSSRWDPTGDFTRYFEEFLAKDNFSAIYGNSGTSSPSLPPPTETAPPPSPPPAPTLPSSLQPVDMTTPPRPIILNRFHDDGELMAASPSGSMTPPAPRPTPPATTPPTTPPVTTRIVNTRPTPITWSSAASEAMPTRFPIRPVQNMPSYTTAITLIDQIGYKIMRTTELFTDILKNTVRAVVG